MNRKIFSNILNYTVRKTYGIHSIQNKHHNVRRISTNSNINKSKNHVTVASSIWLGVLTFLGFTSYQTNTRISTT